MKGREFCIGWGHWVSNTLANLFIFRHIRYIHTCVCVMYVRMCALHIIKYIRINTSIQGPSFRIRRFRFRILKKKNYKAAVQMLLIKSSIKHNKIIGRTVNKRWIKVIDLCLFKRQKLWNASLEINSIHADILPEMIRWIEIPAFDMIDTKDIYRPQIYRHAHRHTRWHNGNCKKYSMFSFRVACLFVFWSMIFLKWFSFMFAFLLWVSTFLDTL